MNARVRAPLAGLALALGTVAVATAAEPPPTQKAPDLKAPTKDVVAADAADAADADFLEFLGAVDAEPDKEDGWLDFLSRADLRRLAGVKQ